MLTIAKTPPIYELSAQYYPKEQVCHAISVVVLDVFNHYVQCICRQLKTMAQSHVKHL